MYVGFDIGGTTIKYGLLNSSGDILEQGAITTNHDKEILLNDLATIVKKYQHGYANILGVGISAPGIIKNGFMLTAGSIKPLYGTEIKKELEERINLPVSVENDGNAAAIAEHWIGNAQGIDNYLCLVLGTGLGAGIVINGKVYKGQHGMAGEFGWMLIDALPQEGNIEEVSMNWKGAVIMGLCRQYNELVKKENPSAKEVFDAREILAKKEQGDKIATKVVSQYLEDLSVMLLNLVSAFDPERILIGGGISANESFMTELQEAYNKNIDRHESLAFLKDVTVAHLLPAKLRNNAGMIGAVYQIHTQLQQEGRI